MTLSDGAGRRQNRIGRLLLAGPCAAALLVVALTRTHGPYPPPADLRSPHGPGLGAQIVEAIQMREAAPAFAAPVIVRAAHFSNGSVEVGISRPLVDAAPAGDLPKMVALVSVTFPPFGGPPRTRSYHALLESPNAAANARAAASTCAFLRRRGALHDLMQITVRARRDGYTVRVQDVPYTTGGFRTVEMSRDLRVRRFTPGE